MAVTTTVGTQTKPLDSEVKRCDGCVQFCKGIRGVLLSEDEVPISWVLGEKAVFLYCEVSKQLLLLRYGQMAARGVTPTPLESQKLHK